MKISLLFLIVGISVFEVLYGKAAMAQYASLRIQLGTFISVNSIPGLHYFSSGGMEVFAPDSLVVKTLGTFEMQAFRISIDSINNPAIEGTENKNFLFGNGTVITNEKVNAIMGLGQIKFSLESGVETFVSITAL